MQRLESDEFQCAVCGGIFKKGWSDEDALAELADRHPGAQPEECAPVCDGCFNALPA